jgi:hypothetical protein
VSQAKNDLTAKTKAHYIQLKKDTREDTDLPVCLIILNAALPIFPDKLKSIADTSIGCSQNVAEKLIFEIENISHAETYGSIWKRYLNVLE